MNNSLVKAYVHAVRELQPTIFIMENVGMLRSEIHRFYYSNTDAKEIDALEIDLRPDVLELIADGYIKEHYSAIIDTFDRYADYLWSDKEYLVINVLFRQRNNHEKLEKAAEKYHHQLENFTVRLLARGDAEFEVVHRDYEMASIIEKYLQDTAEEQGLLAAIETPLMLQRMYRRCKELKDNDIVVNGYRTENGIFVMLSSYPVFEYVKKMLSAQPYSYDITAGVLNAADFGAPQKRERYIVMGVNKGKHAALPKAEFSSDKYRTVRDAFEDLEKVPTCNNVSIPPRKLEQISITPDSLLHSLRDSDELSNHTATQTRETALERFRALKPGQNFHSLPDNLKSTYTDAKRTQNTIYLRLNYDEPSSTVVNVRKSMWVHPVLDRALSIREAARLQTFPDSFVFEGTKDAQYQQVGNAVPPILANALARKVLSILKEEKENVR